MNSDLDKKCQQLQKDYVDCLATKDLSNCYESYFSESKKLKCFENKNKSTVNQTSENWIKYIIFFLFCVYYKYHE